MKLVGLEQKIPAHKLHATYAWSQVLSWLEMANLGPDEPKCVSVAHPQPHP